MTLPDAGLCGLARHEAADWRGWDRSGADGMGGECPDAEQPWPNPARRTR